MQNYDIYSKMHFSGILMEMHVNAKMPAWFHGFIVAHNLLFNM